MDKEYIERGAIERFIENGLNNPDKDKAFGYDGVCILAEVHYMQAADVVEVKHGRWRSKRIGWVHCSECNMANNIRRFRYCPNCGAKMDGE